MILTGVNYRLVPYQYCDLAVPNGGTFTFSKDGMASAIDVVGGGGSGLRISQSGNLGGNWSTGIDSVTTYPITIVTFVSCTKLTNSSGGVVGWHVNGWYIS